MDVQWLLARTYMGEQGEVSDYAAPGPAITDQIFIGTFLGVSCDVHFALR